MYVHWGVSLAERASVLNKKLRDIDFHAARVTAKEHVDETEISLACEIYITIMRKNFQETKTSTQAHTKNEKDPPCSQINTKRKKRTAAPSACIIILGNRPAAAFTN
jgi:hypothetical protein